MVCCERNVRLGAAGFCIDFAGLAANVRTTMTTDDILLEAEEKMMKTEEVVQHEFNGVRTGKASPALVENIMVEVYGSNMRIRELAGITTPEPRMLLLQPWDAASTGPIEKAIHKANLGLNPAVQRSEEHTSELQSRFGISYA